MSELVPVFPPLTTRWAAFPPTSRPRCFATTPTSCWVCTPPANALVCPSTARTAWAPTHCWTSTSGRRAGIAAEHASTAEQPPLPDDAAGHVVSPVENLRDSTGNERVSEIRRAMQETMDMNAQVYRTEETLTQALADIKALQVRYQNVAISDKGRRYNTDLLEAIEAQVPA